jgi:hypothetical protein
MVCIRVGDCGSMWVLRCGSICQLEVQGALEIPEDMLDSCPVDGSRVGVEPCQHTNSIGDVRSGGDGQVHEGPNSTEIGDRLHEVDVFRGGGSHGGGEFGARGHGSGDRFAVSHAIPLKHVKDVLLLREGDGPGGSVPVNLEAKKLGGGAKVSEFEVGGELLDEGLDGRLGLGDEGHVVHKHWDDDPEIVPEEDIDRGVRLDLGEAHLGEGVCKGLGPHPASLPKSIGCLPEEKDITRVAKFLKAFRELHIDLLFQDTIEIGIGDVQGVDLHVFKSSKGKDGPDCRVAHSGGKGLCKVKARALRIALGHKSCLEALHRPISIPLDLEVPLGSNHLLARGKLGNLPGPISAVGLKLLQACLLPLARLRKLLGLFEGSGLRDGGQVGIGSGVEGVISSRVIGVVIGVRGVFLLFLLVIIILIILLWRSGLSRRVIILI